MGLKIFYKCSCMASEAELNVPERRDDEDVVAWMEACVRPALYLDHRQRSPICINAKTEYVKIPAPENAPFIGGKPQTH